MLPNSQSTGRHVDVVVKNRYGNGTHDFNRKHAHHLTEALLSTCTRVVQSTCTKRPAQIGGVARLL